MNNPYCFFIQKHFNTYPFYSLLDFEDGQYELYNALALELVKHSKTLKEKEMIELKNATASFIDDLVNTKDVKNVYLINDFIDTLYGEGYKIRELLSIVSKPSEYCIKTVLSDDLIQKEKFWEELNSRY